MSGLVIVYERIFEDTEIVKTRLIMKLPFLCSVNHSAYVKTFLFKNSKISKTSFI